MTDIVVTDRQTEMVKTIPSALEKMGLVGTWLHDLQLKTKWHKVWGQWPLTQFLSPSFRHPCSDDCHFVTRPASQKSVHRQTVRHMNNWQNTGNSFCVSSCYNTCPQDHSLPWQHTQIYKLKPAVNAAGKHLFDPKSVALASCMLLCTNSRDKKWSRTPERISIIK